MSPLNLSETALVLKSDHIRTMPHSGKTEGKDWKGGCSSGLGHSVGSEEMTATVTSLHWTEMIDGLL